MGATFAKSSKAPAHPLSDYEQKRKSETFGGASDALYTDDMPSSYVADALARASRFSAADGMGPQVERGARDFRASRMNVTSAVYNLAERNASGLTNTRPVFAAVREISSDLKARTDWRPLPYTTQDVNDNYAALIGRPDQMDVRAIEASRDSRMHDAIMYEAVRRRPPPPHALP